MEGGISKSLVMNQQDKPLQKAPYGSDQVQAAFLRNIQRIHDSMEGGKQFRGVL